MTTKIIIGMVIAVMIVNAFAIYCCCVVAGEADKDMGIEEEGEDKND